MQTIKGAQRRMVQMRITDSRYYEEAFFLLKKDFPPLRASDGEMLAEANRILGECAGWQKAQKQPRAAKAGWLICGFFFGAAVSLLVFFLRFCT